MAPTPPPAREVVLITAPDCPLCDKARAALTSLAPEFGLEIREVGLESDPELEKRYRYSFPVVCAGGVPVLSGIVEASALRCELQRAFGPDPLAGVPADEAEFLRALDCPVCAGDLESRPRAVVCLRCGKEYERREGVLLLTEAPERRAWLPLLEWAGRLLSFKLEGRKKV